MKEYKVEQLTAGMMLGTFKKEKIQEMINYYAGYRYVLKEVVTYNAQGGPDSLLFFFERDVKEDATER